MGIRAVHSGHFALTSESHGKVLTAATSPRADDAFCTTAQHLRVRK